MERFEAEPDQLDQAAKLEETERASLIEQSRKLAASIPKGEEGECEGCGVYFERTVNGLCGFCRDKALKRGRLIGREY